MASRSIPQTETLFDPTAPVPEQNRPTDREPDAPGLSVIERMRALRDSPDAGFLPTNRGEVSEAVSLVAFMNDHDPRFPNPTARHLWEIQTRQAKYKADYKATVRSVAREYVSYAKGSYSDLSALMRLEATLHDDDHLYLPPHVRLGEVATELAPTDGVPQLVRYIDGQAAISQGSHIVDGIDILTQRSGDATRGRGDIFTAGDMGNNVRDHVIGVIDATSALHARNMLPAAIADQRQRLAFWYDRVVEAGANRHAWPITNEYLQMARQPRRSA